MEAVPLFVESARRPEFRFRRRRFAFLAASAALQSAFVAGLVLGLTTQPAPVRPAISVRLLRPQLRAPSLPPLPGRPSPPRPSPAVAPPAQKVIQPREAPPELPAPVPEPGPDAASGEAPGEPTGAGGQPDGVVGGAPGVSSLQPAPPPPIPARIHDLRSVRAGIARTLVYPPHARRNGLEGKVVVEFVLLADGRVRDLALRSGSGFPVLDAAALAAVREAAPFPPPGVDVLVVVPVAFRVD